MKEESQAEVLEEEMEIGVLIEWLPKISEEKRAYIKGASTALLYVQEKQCLSQESDNGDFKNQSDSS